MDFCIDRSAIGAEQHFCCVDGKFQWVDDVPDGYVYFHTPSAKSGCLHTLLRLNGNEDVRFPIPVSQINSFQTILRNDFRFEEIAWKQVLPPQVYKRCLTEFIRNIQKSLKKVSTDYLEKIFLPSGRVFESLEHAAIDVTKLEAYKAREESPANKSVLQSFYPVAGSFAKLPAYNRFSARTGRLTVNAGPEILTLKRSYRDIIQSSYKNGEVFYLDFSALEARALLSIGGNKVENADIYTDISSQISNGKFSRQVAKLATLALVYGSGDDSIKKLLNVSENEANEVINQIRTMFKTESLRQKLFVEWTTHNKKIRNYYGRVITVPDEQTLINSFIQSTGVDIALLGFLAIIDEIKEKCYEIRPLFVLHDALILDVHPEFISKLEQLAITGSKILGFENRFFLHFEKLIYTA